MKEYVTMEKRLDPGDIASIRDSMAERDWNETDLANASGISQSTINRMLAGMVNPRLSTWMQVIRVLGGGIGGGNTRDMPARINTKEGGPFRGFTLVPHYNFRAGMGDGDYIYSEQVVDYLAFKTQWLLDMELDPDCILAVACRGTSMEPTIHDKSVCLIDRLAKTAEGVFAIARPTAAPEYEVVIKRLRWTLDRSELIISSDNSTSGGPPVNVSGADLEYINLIGRVVWSGNSVS